MTLPLPMDHKAAHRDLSLCTILRDSTDNKVQEKFFIFIISVFLIQMRLTLDHETYHLSIPSYDCPL
jgi:hypothetical protein